jgi:hypothetical protein
MHNNIDCNQYGSFTEETKIVYEGKMEKQLKDLGSKIDQFILHAETTREDALRDIKVKSDNAKQKLREVKEASEEAWTELKLGMDNAWYELQQAWKELSTASGKAASKFK